MNNIISLNFSLSYSLKFSKISHFKLALERLFQVQNKNFNICMPDVWFLFQHLTSSNLSVNSKADGSFGVEFSLVCSYRGWLEAVEKFVEKLVLSYRKRKV